MQPVEGDIQLGSLTASTSPTSQGRRLLSVRTELAMGGAGGGCTVELAGPELSPPSVGDAVRVSLGAGTGGALRVFTGEVREVSRTANVLRIGCASGLAKLARVEVEAVYENRSAGAIVRDVVGRAGAQAGSLWDGPTFPSYVLHRGRGLRHLLRLAELCGADLFVDREDQVRFVSAQDAGQTHTFRYGEHLLRFSLEEAPPAFDSVVVWGEGAAGARGAGKEHWLVADLTGVSGKAALGPQGAVVPGREGEHSVQVVDGAVRSGEAARQVAEARAAALASRPLRGFLEVLGAPAVSPGDRASVSGLPSDAPASPPLPALRVRCVRHTLDARRGFVTWMGF